MTEERRVLYALVAAGFLAVVAVLIGGAAAVGLVPGWWTVGTTTAWLMTAGLLAVEWRNTRRALFSTIALFLAWTVGTLLLA